MYLEGKNNKCASHPAVEASSFCETCGLAPLCGSCSKFHFYLHGKLLEQLYDWCDSVALGIGGRFGQQKLMYRRLIEHRKDTEYHDLSLQFETVQSALGTKLSAQLAQLHQFSSGTAFSEEKSLHLAKTLKHDLDSVEPKVDKFIPELSRAILQQFRLFATRQRPPSAQAIMACCNLVRGSLLLIHPATALRTEIPLPKSQVFCSGNLHSLFGGPGVAMLGDWVYLLGGFAHSKVSGRTYKLGWAGDTLPVRLADMISPRFDAGVVAQAGRYIYVVSGATFPNKVYEHIRDCERYDIKRDVWSRISPVMLARSTPGICLFKERLIYIYSGQDDASRKVNAVEFYDTLDDSKGWLMAQPEPEIETAISGLALQVSDSEILLVGEKKGYIATVLGGMRTRNMKIPGLQGKFYYRPAAMREHQVYFISYLDDDVIHVCDWIKKARVKNVSFC